MMALPVSLVVISPLSGWLYDRLGSARIISTTGLLLSAFAIFCLMQLDGTASFTAVFWRLAMLGAGQSIFLSPNSASVLSRVPDIYAGITSGILATARNFGMLTGTALAGTSFGISFNRFSGGFSLQDFGPQFVEPFLQAQHLSLALALLLLLIGCGISWLR
jgi:MFS family permease